MIRLPWAKPYLLVVTNLYCNHKCSYCIQQKSSLDVRANTSQIDVDQLLNFLTKNRIDRSIKLMGGELTLHPGYEKLIAGLLPLYKKLVITTNINGKWYVDFDKALEKMIQWGSQITWNTTFHPEWMEVSDYIDRIRAMKKAGLNVDQVATTDTPDLNEATAEKLHNANINWKLQTFTGRNHDLVLKPQAWSDIKRKYPQLYNPSKYIDNYKEYTEECEDTNCNSDIYRPEWVSCTTNKFLIGPDNCVYPCHRHLYVKDKNYQLGHLTDIKMKEFKYPWNKFLSNWTMQCNTKCNPCDFKDAKIIKLNQKNKLYRTEKATA